MQIEHQLSIAESQINEITGYAHELESIVLGYEVRVDSLLVASSTFITESDKVVKELQKQANKNNSRKKLWKWATFIGVPVSFGTGYVIGNN